MALCKTTTNTLTPLYCIGYFLFAIKSIKENNNNNKIIMADYSA